MIPLIKPDVSFDAVADDLRKIIESGYLTSGPYVAAFEAAIRDYLGVEHAVSTTSATTAMHMVLAAMDIGPGDEVLVSDFTFPATGNVVVQTGAVPVLVDNRPGQFDMDPDDLAAKVTPRSRAIIVVHPFGQPADMARINHVAAEHGLKVIEDAACALGTRTADGRYCGAVSDAGCFSFHPRKLLTTGEGGMITTDDPSLAERLSVLRSHGGKRSTVGLEFVENGFNYRMNELQACMGLEQIGRFDAILDERRRVAQLYLEALHGVNYATVPMTADSRSCSFQSFVVMLDAKIDRNRVIAAMKAQGIETTLGTYAMHSHPAFSKYGYDSGDLPNSFAAQQQSLTLPLIKDMSEKDIEGIVAALSEAVQIG